MLYAGKHKQYETLDIPAEVNSAGVREILQRLADYEDTGLEPEICAEYKKFEDEAVSKGMTFKRIVELMEAEKDGRLVELPCKIGDTVYRLCDPKSHKYVGERIVASVSLCGNNSWQIMTTTEDWLGKTVFLTREEAEAALKGRGGDES